MPTDRHGVFAEDSSGDFFAILLLVDGENPHKQWIMMLTKTKQVPGQPCCNPHGN